MYTLNNSLFLPLPVWSHFCNKSLKHIYQLSSNVDFIWSTFTKYLFSTYFVPSPKWVMGLKVFRNYFELHRINDLEYVQPLEITPGTTVSSILAFVITIICFLHLYFLFFLEWIIIFIIKIKLTMKFLITENP